MLKNKSRKWFDTCCTEYGEMCVCVLLRRLSTHIFLLVTSSHCRSSNDLQMTTTTRATNPGQARASAGASSTQNQRHNSTNPNCLAAGGMSLSQRNRFVTQFLPTKVRTTLKPGPLCMVVFCNVPKNETTIAHRESCVFLALLHPTPVIQSIN